MKSGSELELHVLRLSQLLHTLHDGEVPAGDGDDRPRAAAPASLSAIMEEVHALQRTAKELRFAEEELQAQNCQLAELGDRLKLEQQKYRELFEEAPDSYLVTDLGANVLEANRAASQLLNEQRGRLVGRPLVSFVASAECPRFWAQLDALSEGLNPREFELTLIPRQLTPVDASVRVSPMASRSHRPVALRWLIRDITRRKNAERLLQATLIQLRQSERLASVGMLAAGVAHEIANPLNAILMAVQCARYSRDARQLDEIIDAIQQEAGRVGRIAQGLLKVARAEPSAREPCQLNELIRHVVDMARSYPMGQSLELVTDLSDRLPVLELSRTEMEQVLVHLIRNAAEAADRPVRLTLRTRLDPDSLRLTVEDNGPGIDEAQIQYIFDPFFTTRQAEGRAGLGLSIVHSIISDHGGSITVQSRPGQGCCFTIRLPVPGRG